MPERPTGWCCCCCCCCSSLRVCPVQRIVYLLIYECRAHSLTQNAVQRSIYQNEHLRNEVERWFISSRWTEMAEKWWKKNDAIMCHIKWLTLCQSSGSSFTISLTFFTSSARFSCSCALLNKLHGFICTNCSGLAAGFGGAAFVTRARCTYSVGS